MAFTANIDSVKVFRLGTKKNDVAGNRYIYLKGVASTAVGDAVTYDSAFASARLSTSSSAGPVAFAMSANVAATTYGWYQIGGIGVATAAGTVAANAQLQATATAGQLDDTTTAGKTVVGVVSLGSGTTGSTLSVWIAESGAYYEGAAIV